MITGVAGSAGNFIPPFFTQRGTRTSPVKQRETDKHHPTTGALCLPAEGEWAPSSFRVLQGHRESWLITPWHQGHTVCV